MVYLFGRESDLDVVGMKASQWMVADRRPQRAHTVIIQHFNHTVSITRDHTIPRHHMMASDPSHEEIQGDRANNPNPSNPEIQFCDTEEAVVDIIGIQDCEESE